MFQVVRMETSIKDTLDIRLSAPAWSNAVFLSSANIVVGYFSLFKTDAFRFHCVLFSGGVSQNSSVRRCHAPRPLFAVLWNKVC